MSVKERVFVLLNEQNVAQKAANRRINGFIMLLIFLSVAEVIVESYTGLEAWIRQALSVFEVVVVIIFTVEYLLRIWIADLRFPELSPGQARIKFMTSFVGVIDLIAILPFYLPFLIVIDLRVLRVLRVMRLLRIFKLNRHSTSLCLVGDVKFHFMQPYTPNFVNQLPHNVKHLTEFLYTAQNILEHSYNPSLSALNLDHTPNLMPRAIGNFDGVIPGAFLRTLRNFRSLTCVICKKETNETLYTPFYRNAHALHCLL